MVIMDISIARGSLKKKKIESMSLTESDYPSKSKLRIPDKKKALIFLILLNVSSIMFFGLHKSFTVEPERSHKDLSGSNIRQYPEMKLQTFCKRMKTLNEQGMTSIVSSKPRAVVIPGSGRIIVYIETFNQKNISKLNGGDLILVFARQSNGDGRVPGSVIDHYNGCYTGTVNIFWRGRTEVYVKLVSSIENTCLRLNVLEKYGNIVYTLNQPYGLRAVYVRNGSTELAPCNTNNFIYNSRNICNFTTLNSDMSWYCGHPTRSHYKCSDLKSFSLGPFARPVDVVNRNDKIHKPGYGMFKTKMETNVQSNSPANTSIYCNTRDPSESWKEAAPTGYYLKGQWVQTNCKTTLKHTINNYRTCLRNKTLIMLGDSTVRQYVNFFLKDILSLNAYIDKDQSFGQNFQTYHRQKTFTNRGISVVYRKQALPLHFGEHSIPIKDIQSFPKILDSVGASDAPSSSMIVLINYHTHFSAFPPARYRERIRQLVEALKRFLGKKPSAKVFFKGPSVCISNTKWWDPRISLLFGEIVKEEFADILDRVIYLNVWDIAVAHDLTDVHPQGKALKSQIHQFMSFIC